MKKKQAQSKLKRDAARRHRHEAGGALVGALGGAGLGMVAGPPGMVAGAILGGAAGTLTSWALESNATDLEARNKRLDAEIGVIGGDIGVPGLEHPPPKTGAYSIASTGLDDPGESRLAEGPIQPPPK
jgi:hypothetical protein